MSFTTWAPVKLSIISPARVSSPAGDLPGRIIAEIASKGNLRQWAMSLWLTTNDENESADIFRFPRI